MDLSYSRFNVPEESEEGGGVGRNGKQQLSYTTATTTHKSEKNDQKGSLGGGLFISAISPTDKYTQSSLEQQQQ